MASWAGKRPRDTDNDEDELARAVDLRRRLQERRRRDAPVQVPRDKTTCAPAAGRWCTSCEVGLNDAATSDELLTLDAAVRLAQAAQATQQCPYFICAYVMGLKLRRSESLLIDLEPIISDKEEPQEPQEPREPQEPEPPAPLPPSLPLPRVAQFAAAPPNAKEEEEQDENIWQWPAVPRLALTPVGAVPDEDSLVDETPEERDAYETQFDRTYARLCRVPRYVKSAIRRRFWANRGFQRRNVHPHEARVVMDPGPHIYLIDGDARDTVSVSTYMKDMFEPFDSAMMSKRLVGKGRTKGCTTPAEVLATWDRARDNGTAFHAAMENVARVERDRLFQFKSSDVIAEAPPGFYRFLEMHPFLAFLRCELSLCDFASRICGQADAVMTDTRNGDIWLIDYKNTNKIYDTAFFGKVCTHPLTRGLPDCNGVKYDFQVNAYRHMIETSLGWPVAKMLLLNFKPGAPADEDLEMTVIARRDMGPFFQARAIERVAAAAAAAGQ